nr:hypothetical protein [Tanacetum cinerariifolium]
MDYLAQSLTCYEFYLAPFLQGLDDAKGATCLPNDTIFKELARMSTMTSAIIWLANNQKFNFSKYILESMVKNLEGGVKFLMYPRRKLRKEAEVPQDEIPKVESVLYLEEAKTAQAKEIASLKKSINKLKKRRKSRTIKLKRLKKVGAASMVESSKDIASLGDQEDASKQGRMINNIDQDAEIALVDEAHGRMDDQDMFGVNDLVGDEVVVGEKEEQSLKVAEKEVSTAEPVTTAGEVATTANVEVSDALTTTTTTHVDELPLVKTLIEIKAAKPKAKPKAITTAATTVIAATTRLKAKGIAKDKGEGKMVEPEKPLTRKKQAMIDVDCELAAKLQKEERGELCIKEKSKLFVELMNKRKKHFEILRAEERRRRPPTKAQKKKQMCTYLKNMAGFTHNQLKSKSFEEVQQAFNKTYEM